MEKSGKFSHKRENKWCRYHQTNGHLVKQCFQQIQKSERIINGRQKNGIACTIARVISIKNAFKKRVAVNVRTFILLLMTEIVKNMKPWLQTAQQLTASRAAVVAVKLRRCPIKRSRIFTATWYRV